MLLKRLGSKIILLINYLRWKSKFKDFGWGSILDKYDILHKPEAISIGKNVKIMKGARIETVGEWDHNTPKISIGDNTIIHLYFHCGAAKSIKIGNNVLIAGRVYITDHDHVFDDPERAPIQCRNLSVAPVFIDDGAWLGEGCVILKGVTIGKRAVIGANSVVTKDVPPFTVVAGVPAKKIKKIFLDN